MEQRNATEEHRRSGGRSSSSVSSVITVIFIVLVLGLAFLCINNGLKQLSSLEWQNLKIPRTVGQAKGLATLVNDHNYWPMVAAYWSVYVVLQSFGIPGSLGLSILAGFIFPGPLALMMICTCSALGATVCYLLVSVLFRKWVLYLFPGRIEQYSDYVRKLMKKYQSDWLFSMFALRATPIFPNWFINLSSPIIEIPLVPFALGTFTGVAPLSLLHISTGRVLNEMSNDANLFTWKVFANATFIGFMLVFSIYLSKKMVAGNGQPAAS